MAYPVLFNPLFQRCEPVDTITNVVAQQKEGSDVGQPVICALSRVVDHLSTDHILDSVFTVQHSVDLVLDHAGRDKD